MRASSEFEIPYTGLGVGRHAFGFQLDGSFFSEFEPEGFADADIEASTELDRFEGMMHFDVHVKGVVLTSCDRCNAPVSLPIDNRVRYVVKFGDRTHRTDDDILVLGPAEHVFNVTEFLYESTILGLPLKRVHADDQDCDEQVLRWLSGSVDHAPNSEENEEEDGDPRWAALKKWSSSSEQEEGDQEA